MEPTEFTFPRLLVDDITKSIYYNEQVNPTKPCIVTLCPNCRYNRHASEVLRVTGEWTTKVGAQHEWNPAEPLGLMTYDESICRYTLYITGLEPGKYYKWKVNI